MTEPPKQPLLSVRDLAVYLRSAGGPVRAVDGVSFDIGIGETLGLVGESGCGKSMTALSILSLVPTANVLEKRGSIAFDSTELIGLPDRDMRHLRGNKIAMIFQEPMTSLNPVLKVGRQIAETLIRHRSLSRRAAENEAVDLLARVGIPSPRERAREYPHRLSGGMRQRAMIAMAIACRPKLLIADEPTTALDVTIQAQILELIQDLKAEMGMAVLLITHNFGIVAQIADRTAVMYTGRIVETAPTADLLDAPGHPYTAGLLRAIPRLGDKVSGDRRRLQEIPGMVPRLTEERRACSFAPRCSWRFGACLQEQPGILRIGPDHYVRCVAQEPETAERSLDLENIL